MLWPAVLLLAGPPLLAMLIGYVIGSSTSNARLGLGIGAILGAGWIAVFFFFTGADGVVPYRVTRLAETSPPPRDDLGDPVQVPMDYVAFVFLDRPGCFALVDSAVFRGHVPEPGTIVQLNFGVTRDFGRIRAYWVDSIDGVPTQLTDWRVKAPREIAYGP